MSIILITRQFNNLEIGIKFTSDYLNLKTLDNSKSI